MNGWKILMEAGLPDGPPRPASCEPLRKGALRTVLAKISASPEALSGTERDTLAAWLSAFRHHWPARFEEILGREGESLRLSVRPTDANRYLKLRRIAIENLAGRL